MTLTRRDTLILAASASLAGYFGASPAWAQEGTTKDVSRLANVALPDHPLGAENAPVTVIEYASPTCPHCAAFHTSVLPTLETEYIETGKVRFLLRPFLRNVLDAAVFMLAEAAGDDMFHTVIATYFRTHSQWAASNRPRDELLAIAKQLGFTDASFDEALKDTELLKGLEAVSDQARDEFNLEGTPTFYINGKQLTGGKTVEQMRAEIDPLVPADFQPTQPGAESPAAEPAADAPATDAPAEEAEPETPASN